MKELLFIAWLAFFTWLIGQMSFFRRSGLSYRALLLAFLLKIAAGSGLVLIYTYYYTDRSTADIYKYFDDGKIIYSALQDHPLYYFQLVSGINSDDPRLEPYTSAMKNWSQLSGQWLDFTQTKDYNLFSSNRLVTRFNALIMPFSQGNIYIHVLFSCFFSLLGLTALYRQVRSRVKGNEALAFIVIFLLPSTLLWCSGVLKDGLVLAFLNLLLYLLLPPHKSLAVPIKLLRWIGILLLVFLILLTKYYVLAALLLPFLAHALYRVFRQRIPAWTVYAVTAGLLFLLVLVQPLVYPHTTLWSVLAAKREEALKTAIWAEAKHQVFYHTTEPTASSVFKEVPAAVFSALFRPLPPEAGKAPFLLLASLENMLLLGFFGWLLFRLDRTKRSDEYMLLFLSYSLVLAFIIGFTTPVTGGIVRYKTAFLPYLLLAAVIAMKPGRNTWQKVSTWLT